MKNGARRDAKAAARAAAKAQAIPSHPLLAGPRGQASGARNGAAAARAPVDPAALTVVEPVRPAIARSAKAKAKAKARRGARRMPVEKVIRESGRWLDIIARTARLTASQKQRIIKETVRSFSTYFNTGFLAYRKSVAEAEQYASVEWTGEGTFIEDITGRQYIDCLGGFGIYSAGIRHPRIVEAVRNQLERMPMSSQELLDPLRGALAELLGEIAPGNLQKCFFINNGTDAIEGAMKLARLHTEKSGFISTIRGFHG
jgi:hypothetical protein